jgi:competence ComEA-like helix-hairpin-helix protein
VIEYYERFLKRFPSLGALAGAEREAVLKSWEGLGYYRRARNLHLAAQMVCDDGGRIPSTAEQLRRLPGVGPARASAILRGRSDGGLFSGAEGLGRVPGIGPATAARLAVHLTLSPVQPASAAPLSINRAEIKDLEQIPRIGPVLARRIVADRDRLGSFKRPEDLLRVAGIGTVTLDRLRPYLRFD